MPATVPTAHGGSSTSSPVIERPPNHLLILDSLKAFRQPFRVSPFRSLPKMSHSDIALDLARFVDEQT